MLFNIYYYLYQLLCNFLQIFYQLEYYLEPFIYQTIKCYYSIFPSKLLNVNEIYLINLSQQSFYKRKVSNDFLKILKINYFDDSSKAIHNLNSNKNNLYLQNKFLLINYNLKFNYLYKFRYNKDRNLYNLNGNYYILYDLENINNNDFGLFNYIYDYIYHFNLNYFKSNLYTNKGIELLECVFVNNNEQYNQIDITSFINKLLGPDKNYHNNFFNKLNKYKVDILYKIQYILNNKIDDNINNIFSNLNHSKFILKDFDFEEKEYLFNDYIN
jgi:hypothetical protein